MKGKFDGIITFFERFIKENIHYLIDVKFELRVGDDHKHVTFRYDTDYQICQDFPNL